MGLYNHHEDPAVQCSNERSFAGRVRNISTRLACVISTESFKRLHIEHPNFVLTPFFWKGCIFYLTCLVSLPYNKVRSPSESLRLCFGFVRQDVFSCPDLCLNNDWHE